jgi:hypothetical protein
MDKFNFNILISNLKEKSGNNDLSKNSDIMELAQIVGVKEINDEDALYDGIIKFISNQKKEIEKHIRCFLGEDRYIADSEDNIILLYLLYDKYLYKDKVSRCIKELGDEDSNELLKVGNLLANLFRKYHKDYYSRILIRAESLGKSIEEKINTINELTISYGNRAKRSKNDLTLLILVLLNLVLLGIIIYLKNIISDLDNELITCRLQQLVQEINKLK